MNTAITIRPDGAGHRFSVSHKGCVYAIRVDAAKNWPKAKRVCATTLAAVILTNVRDPRIAMELVTKKLANRFNRLIDQILRENVQ